MNKRICNECKQEFYISFTQISGFNKKLKLVSVDQYGRIYHGKRCIDCKRKILNKKLEQKGYVNPLIDVECIQCKTIFKQKTGLQKLCSIKCRSKYNYWTNLDYFKKINKENCIKRSKVKQCKICNKDFKTIHSKLQKYCSVVCQKKNNDDYVRKYQRNYYGYEGKQIKRCLVKLCCLYCQKIFETKLLNRKFCSKVCSSNSQKINKIIKQKQIFNKECLFCSQSFQTSLERKKYCSEKCLIKFSHKKHYKKRKIYEKIRELKKKQRVPKWANIKKIESIYNKCPPNHHVDHIIPLNNPNVCGFHVEYNLQYLPSHDNIIKSNKFDGTYDNNSWKTIK